MTGNIGLLQVWHCANCCECAFRYCSPVTSVRPCSQTNDCAHRSHVPPVSLAQIKSTHCYAWNGILSHDSNLFPAHDHLSLSWVSFTQKYPIRRRGSVLYSFWEGPVYTWLWARLEARRSVRIWSRSNAKPPHLHKSLFWQILYLLNHQCWFQRPLKKIFCQL
jgi:hypothetical protein